MHVLQVALLNVGVWVVGIAVLSLLFRRRRVPVLVALGVSFLAGTFAVAGAGVLLTASSTLTWYPHVVVTMMVLAVATCVWRWRWFAQTFKPGWREAVVALAAFVLFVPVLLATTVQEPNAADAKAVWLLKAKAFSIESSPYNAFYQDAAFESANRDYPIGFPLAVSLFERIDGVRPQLAGPYVASFFLAVELLLGGAMLRWLKRGRLAAALLTMIIVAGAPEVMGGAGNFYADFAFSLAVASVVACLCELVVANKNERAGWAAAALLSSGAGLLFKNEGLPLAVVTFGSVVVAYVWWYRRTTLRPLAGLSVPALLALFPHAVWLWLRGSLNIQSRAFGSLDPNFISTQPLQERIQRIVFSAAAQLASFDLWRWGFVTAVLVSLGGVVLLISKRTKLPALLPVVAVLLQVGSYAFVYAISTYEIGWLLATSLERVSLQIFPALWVLAAYCIGTAGSLAARAEHVAEEPSIA